MDEKQPGNRLIDLTGQSFEQLTVESRYCGKGKIAQWAREKGIDPRIIYQRIKRGWSHEDAVLTPSGEKRNENSNN